MKTRREALVEAGLAKPGRGKFSSAAKEWLDAQRVKGVKFSDDDAPVKSAPKPTGEPVEKVVKSNPGDTPWIDPKDYRFPEAEYKLVVPKGTPAVGMRNVCDNCNLSFVNHACNSPEVFGIIVKIERR